MDLKVINGEKEDFNIRIPFSIKNILKQMTNKQRIAIWSYIDSPSIEKWKEISVFNLPDTVLEPISIKDQVKKFNKPNEFIDLPSAILLCNSLLQWFKEKEKSKIISTKKTNIKKSQNSSKEEPIKSIGPRLAFEKILESEFSVASIFVKTSTKGIKLPESILDNHSVNLDYSHGFIPPMNIELLSKGIQANMSFNGVESVTFIPWTAILAVYNKENALIPVWYK